MRRTLAILVTAGAFLVPAGAASAADVHENASCSNGKGGNYAPDNGRTYNGHGNTLKAQPECAPKSVGGDEELNKDRDPV